VWLAWLLIHESAYLAWPEAWKNNSRRKVNHFEQGTLIGIKMISTAILSVTKDAQVNERNT